MIMLPHIGLFGDFENCQKNITAYLNRNFLVIDAIMQMKILSFVTSLPEDPEIGDIYILETSYYSYGYDENALMIWSGDNWVEVEAQKGMIAYVESEDNLFWYNGTSWVIIPIFSENSVFESIETSNLLFVESELNSDLPDIDAPETVVVNLTGDMTEIDSIQSPSSGKTSLYIFKNISGHEILIKDSVTFRTGTGKDFKFRDQSAITVLYSEVDSQYILVGGGSGSGSGVIQVADDTEREDIPDEDRTEGMLVYVLSTGLHWTLKGGILDSNWYCLGFIIETALITGSGSTTSITPTPAASLEIYIDPTAHDQQFYINANTVGGRILKINNSSAFRAAITPQGGESFTIPAGGSAILVSGYMSWSAVSETNSLLLMPLQTFSADGVATLAYTARQIIRLESTNTVERVVTLPAPDSTQKELFITGTSDNFPIKILEITLTSDKTLHLINVGGVWKLVQGA